MSDIAIRLENVGKLYKLYRRPLDKVFDAFGVNRWLFWRRDYFQEFWALRGLNLAVSKGERVGIIGRNGAGKSTLLKIIAKTIAPTEGIAVVDGRIQALLELGTGFHPEFTGRQNIRAALAYQGFSARQIRDKEEDIIDFAELEDFIEQPIKTYSAGMYARLAFSTATAIEPEILIIDEILGAGDAYFAGKCLERMKKVTEDAGATVLFVSHDLGSVQRFCKHVVWLDRGQIRHQGEPLETLKAYAAMVRQEEALRLKARDLKVLKKQAAALSGHADAYDGWLFHLTGANGAPPAYRHRIFHLRLRVGQEELGSIAVGGPMDNSPEHLHYLIDTPRYMDWGPAQRERETAYREYGNFRGKYAHAPFEFAVPKTFRLHPAAEDFCLEIEAEVTTEEVAIEVYAQGKYVRLGCLDIGPRHTTVLRFSQSLVVGEQPSPVCGNQAADARMAAITEAPLWSTMEPIPPHTSEYGSGEARITAVRMLDTVGRESRVFETGQPFTVSLEFEAYTELPTPVFVFCVYLVDGQCFTQWIATAEQLGYRRIRGQGRVVFVVQNAVLGSAAYVASAAIFKRLRSDGREAESYHILDRCIHFQVLPGTGEAIERGLCLQPFTAELQLR